MSERRRLFPTIVLLVIVACLVAVATIILISFSPIQHSAEAVNSVEQAEDLVEQYLENISGDFRIEEIKEFSHNFYVIVQEKSTGINAFELLVDRYTGNIGEESGSNMMWNLKHEYVERTSNLTASMLINSQQASRYAQRWVDKNIPVVNIEKPKAFYGYYTMDVSINGRIIGMLSVNGHTGYVWYHPEHGKFMGMEKY